MPRQLNRSRAIEQLFNNLCINLYCMYCMYCTFYEYMYDARADGVGADALEARAAAQAVLPSFQRSLHKYLRITRQQCRFTLEQVTHWLALALSFDLSPRLFLARFLQPGTTPSPDTDTHTHTDTRAPSLRSSTVPFLLHHTVYFVRDQVLIRLFCFSLCLFLSRVLNISAAKF